MTNPRQSTQSEEENTLTCNPLLDVLSSMSHTLHPINVSSVISPEWIVRIPRGPHRSSPLKAATKIHPKNEQETKVYHKLTKDGEGNAERLDNIQNARVSHTKENYHRSSLESRTTLLSRSPSTVLAARTINPGLTCKCTARRGEIKVH